MRPIKLEIEGIQSFKERQTIDFDYLSSNGIFGIFGPTGSGKSTILDCIILSLYGKINRSKINSDFINTKCKEARVYLVFSFRSQNKVRKYEVERLFKKSKKNEQEVEQSAVLNELNALGKKQLAEGAFKVDAYLKDLLGMGESEFSKCIALPQGEFAGFLKSKPSERINIIGNIFNLNEYGTDLWEKATERLVKIKDEKNELSAKLSMFHIYTAEEIKKFEDELTKRRHDIKINAEELESLQKNKKALETNIDLHKRRSMVDYKISELCKQESEINKDRSIISKSEEIDKISDKMERREELEDTISFESKKLTEIKSMYDKTNKEYQAKLFVYNDNENEIEQEIDDSLSKLQYLKNLADSEPKIEEASKEMNLLGKKLEGLQKQRDDQSNKVDDIQKQIDAKDNEIDASNAIIEKNKTQVSTYNELTDLRQISKQIEMIDEFSKSFSSLIDGKHAETKQATDELFSLSKKETELRSGLTKIIDSVDKVLENHTNNSYEKLRQIESKLFRMQASDHVIKSYKKYINELKLENDERLVNIKSIEDKITTCENVLAVHDEGIIQCEQIVENERAEREGYLGQNVLSIMLEHTEIGDECPICRSSVIQKNIAPKTDLVVYDKNIMVFKQNLKQARLERDKIVSQLAGLSTLISAEQSKIKLNQKKISSIEKEIEKEFIKFVDISDNAETEFYKLFDTIKSTVSMVEKLIENEEQIKEKMDEIDRKRVELGAKILYSKEVSDEIGEVYNLFQSVKAEKEMVVFKYIGREKDIYEMTRDLRKFAKESEEARDNLLKLTEEKRGIIDKLGQEKLKLSALQNEIDRTSDKIEDLRSKIKDLKDPIQKETYGDLKEYISKFEEKLIAKRNKFKEDKAFLVKKNEELGELEKELKIISSKIENYNSDIDSLDKSLRETMDKLGVNFAVELKKFKLSNEEKTKTEKKVKDYDNSLSLLQAEKKELDEKIGNEPCDEVSYTALLQKINEEVSKQNAERENLGNLTSSLERMREEFKSSNELSNKIDVLNKKFDTAKELCDIIRGKALMEFVAEEYIDDITKIASNKLMLLKEGEFSLVFENKEFFVIDNFNDGAKRSAATLSGGETFIVSLSLALAISEAIIRSSDKSMDFFFLDEGFGTLDSDLCETVIDALYKLESQNLTIGLISHVQELKNSIKSKLLIKKSNSGSAIEYDCTL